MGRNILDKIEDRKDKGEVQDSPEYTPPEDELVDSALLDRLLEHYTNVRDYGKTGSWGNDDFKFEVKSVESIIREATGSTNPPANIIDKLFRSTKKKAIEDNFRPQLFIDALALKLRNESDSDTKYGYSRTFYLGTVVQALFNLGCNKFVIDIKDWPDDEYVVGMYLQGKGRKPLILDLHGQIKSCGHHAENCSFTFHEDTTVAKCSDWAKNCTFNLIPDAKIEEYGAQRSQGNVLRVKRKNGEWEIIG